jgi:hypothetical protein
MKRQEFLKRISLFSIFSGIPIFTTYREKFVQAEFSKKIAEFYIAGYFFYDGDKAESELILNDILTLQREPENIYDKNAIEIYIEKIKLGYIPRYCNDLPATMLDNGIKIEARIGQINKGMPTWERIRVELFI